MDHRGLRERLTGSGCAACGAAIPVDRIAVLADRGDVAFVELSCGACASRTLCMVLPPDPNPQGPADGTAVRPGSRAGADADPWPATSRSSLERPPLTESDVTAMGRFLAGWEGDLRSLLDRHGGSSRPGTSR